MVTGVGMVELDAGLFDESAVVENHVSNGGAASVRAILPAGIREDSKIGVCRNTGVKTDVIDGIGCAIRIEFKSVVGVVAKMANKASESVEIDYPTSKGSNMKSRIRYEKKLDLYDFF
jgi:hypothetical protein